MQRVFKADIVSARLLKFQNLRRRATELLARILTRLFYLRHAINKFALAKNRNEQIDIVGPCGNLSPPLGSNVDNYGRLADCVIDFINRVSNESAVQSMKSAYLQQTRAGCLRGFIGKFDPITPRFARATHRAQFVNAAYSRVWLTSR